jgi:NADH-quinone oxidoreductase subunit J
MPRGDSRQQARRGQHKAVIEAIIFYMLAGIIVLSAVAVIFARNPVHSVLWLILAFFNAAGLFVLLGAEFLAMLLVIVYVGAVAVLFLFVVMMLDIDFAELRSGMARHLPFGLLLAGVLLAEVIIAGTAWQFAPTARAVAVAPAPAAMANTAALGAVLYTRYVYVFIAAGMVLLVAMIGAIVLTHRQRPGVRKQHIGRQVARTIDQSVEVVKVPVGEGVTLR